MLGSIIAHKSSEVRMCLQYLSLCFLKTALQAGTVLVSMEARIFFVVLYSVLLHCFSYVKLL